MKLYVGSRGRIAGVGGSARIVGAHEDAMFGEMASVLDPDVRALADGKGWQR